MGTKKQDQRAANYQAKQRREAAAAKAEKERQKREDYWSQAVVPIQQSGGIVYSPGIQIASGGNWINSGPWQLSAWVKSDDYTQVAPLPRSESTEVITAYRMWPLVRSFPGGYRLSAMNAHLDGKITPNEKLVAECKAFGYPTQGHEAPHDDCQCGIHAYSKSVPLDPSDKPYAAGEVYLWGKVIVHERGYRAQFAYPKKLYVIDGGPRADKIADALSWTYGVPCEVWDG